MIELPDFASTASMSATFDDPGFVQRAMQSDSYVPRKGGRYRVRFAFPPYEPARARLMIARLIAGKQGGIRVRLPLLQPQGSPGAPVVSSASGRTLALTGLTPGYAILEGYWLSLVKSGQHFLHSVGVGAVANGSGAATIELNELLRDTFPAGSVVNLAVPRVEGLIEGDEASWTMPVGRRVALEFTIKEVR